MQVSSSIGQAIVSGVVEWMELRTRACSIVCRYVDHLQSSVFFVSFAARGNAEIFRESSLSVY